MTASLSLAVSLGLWQDRPPEEALATAALAEELGYGELWLGEMATWDVFALATAVGLGTARIPLTLGPLAVTVRDPAMIAMGAASVAALTGRPVGVAIGTSSDVVVRDWHGRSRRAAAAALTDSARALRTLLDGGKAQVDGAVRSVGYRLRLPAPRSPLTVAAFGPKAVRAAAEHADRLVLNLVSPARAAELVTELRAAAKAAGRPAPAVATWVPACAEPDADALTQLGRGLVGYLAAPGYAEMFRREGFGAVVDLAATRPHPGELLAAVPPELIAAVGLLGSPADLRARAAAYAEAGVTDLVLVPTSTPADPAGAVTLRTTMRTLGGR